MFRSTQFSDVKIRLGEAELPAHGFVLSAQTDYFARALASKFEEGATGTFQYNEGSMHAYWRCFKYIYTGEYAEEPAAELSVPGRHNAALFLFFVHFFHRITETKISRRRRIVQRNTRV